MSNEKAPITHEGRNNDGESSLVLGRVLKYPNHWCDCWIKGVSVYDKGLSDEEVDAVFGKFKQEIIVPSGEAEEESVDPYDGVVNCTQRRFQSMSSGNYIDGRSPEHLGESLLMTEGRQTNTLCFDWDLSELSDGTFLIKNLRSMYYLDGRDKGSKQGNHVALRGVTEDEAKASDNFKWVITEHSFNGKTRHAIKSVSSGYQLCGGRKEKSGHCLGLEEGNPEGDRFLLWNISDAEEPMFETKYTYNRISNVSTNQWMDGRAPGYYQPCTAPKRTKNTLCFDWELAELFDGTFLMKNLRSKYYLEGKGKGSKPTSSALRNVLSEDAAKAEDKYRWIVTEHSYNGKTRLAFKSVTSGYYLESSLSNSKLLLNGGNPEGNSSLLWDLE